MTATTRPHRSRYRSAQSGFSLLEVLLVTGAMTFLVVAISAVITDLGQRARSELAARELLHVQTAAEQFVKTNFTQLLDSAVTGNIASSGDVRVITVQDLVAQNYLGNGTRDTNVLNLRMRVWLRNDTPVAAGSDPAISIITVTEPPAGAPATDTGRPHDWLAKTADFGKGRIGLLSNVGATYDTNGFVSNSNQWRVALTQLTGYGPTLPPLAAPASGATGYIASYGRMTSDDIFLPDVLYRVPIAGYPQYNEMETDLDMGGFQMTDMQTMTADSVSAGSATLAANGVSYGFSTIGTLTSSGAATLNGDTIVYSDNNNNPGVEDLSTNTVTLTGPATLGSTTSNNLTLQGTGLVAPNLTVANGMNTADLVVNNTMAIGGTTPGAITTQTLQLGGANSGVASLQTGNLSARSLTTATTVASGPITLPNGNHTIAGNARINGTANIPRVTSNIGIFQDLCYTGGASAADNINGC